MPKQAVYRPDDIDIDALLSLSKLELSQSEKESFLADMCDMANYTYDKLSCESADGTLATAERGQKCLGELREDKAELYRSADSLLKNAPLSNTEKNMIAVPRALGAKEGGK